MSDDKIDEIKKKRDIFAPEKGETDSSSREAILNDSVKRGEIAEELITSICSEDFCQQSKKQRSSIQKRISEIVEKEIRIPYSLFSTLLFAKIDKADFNYMVDSNLALLMNDTSDEKNQKILMKLNDHMILVREQYKQIQKTTKSIEEYQDKIKKQIEDDYKEHEKKQQEFEEKINTEIHKNKTDTVSFTISILAIFTALSFVLFTGVSGISGVAELMSKDSFPLGLLYFFIFALIILGAICLFVYFVLIIVGGMDSRLRKNYGFTRVSVIIMSIIAGTIICLFFIWCILGRDTLRIKLSF